MAMGDKGVAQYFNFLSRKLGIAGVTYTEELTSQLINTVEALVYILSEDNKIVVFNPACERLSGYKKQEVLGKRYEMLVPAEEVERVAQGVSVVFSDNRTWQDEIEWFTKDGKRRLIAWSKTRFTEKNGFARYLLATGLDVTEERLREKRRSLSLEIFATIGSTINHDGVLEQILELLRDYFQCDAAGIRLRKGGDYPYIKTSGFPAGFVSEDTMLCSPRPNGQSSITEESAALECICGRVICGDLDLYLSSIAGQGGFFTGNINELTSLLAKNKFPFTIRNYCGQSGFSSIVWLPLRFRGETVGLLQLNDRAPDKFTSEEVEFLSIVAQNIGGALVRFNSEQRSKGESVLVTLLEKSREGFFVSSHEGSISFYSKAMEQICGYTKDQVAEHGWFYLVFPYEEERRQAVQKARLVMAGKLEFVEFEITRKDGEKNWVRFSVTPLEIARKQYTLTTLSEMAKSAPIKTGSLPILN
ncbi:MAG: PAS domain S-box protein [Dethiobacter sp.]|nr:PAS domain S-box protein [Dethiobacter sp.]